MKRTEGSSEAANVVATEEEKEISSDFKDRVDIEKMNFEEYLEAEDSIQEVFRPNFGDYTINPPLMPLANHIALLLKKRCSVVKPVY